MTAVRTRPRETLPVIVRRKRRTSPPCYELRVTIPESCRGLTTLHFVHRSIFRASLPCILRLCRNLSQVYKRAIPTEVVMLRDRLPIALALSGLFGLMTAATIGAR